MTNSRSNRLIDRAKTIMKKHGIPEDFYDNVYAATKNEHEAIYVVRFRRTKAGNKRLILKQEVGFKKAAKVFKEQTGVDLVRIW